MNEDGIQNAESRLSGQDLETGVMFAKQTDFRAAFADQVLKITAGRRMAQSSVVSAITAKQTAEAAQPATATQAVTRAEFTGLKVEEATAKLEAAGVIVDGVERIDPRNASRNLARLAISPRTLRAGTRVTLIEQNGVVQLAEQTSDSIRVLREEMAETKRTVDESRAAIARTEALEKEVGTLRQELTSRDQVIAELRASTRQFQEHAESLRALRDQVESIKSVVRLPPAGSEEEKQ